LPKSAEDDFKRCAGELVPCAYAPTPEVRVQNGSFEEGLPGWFVLHGRTYRLDIDDPAVKAKTRFMAYRASMNFDDRACTGRRGAAWGSYVHGTPVAPNWIKVHSGHLLRSDGSAIGDMFLPLCSKEGMPLLHEIDSGGGIYHAKSGAAEWGGVPSADGEYHLAFTGDGNAISQEMPGHVVGTHYVLRFTATFPHSPDKVASQQVVGKKISMYYVGVRFTGARIRDPTHIERSMVGLGLFYGGNEGKQGRDGHWHGGERVSRRYDWTVTGNMKMEGDFLVKYVAEQESVGISLVVSVPPEMQEAWAGERLAVHLDNVQIKLHTPNTDLAAELRDAVAPPRRKYRMYGCC